LSIGAGFYLGGIICTLVIYFILAYSHKAVGKLEHLNTFSFNIITNNTENILDEIKNSLEKQQIIIKKINSIVSEDKKNIMIRIVCKCKIDETSNSIISQLAKIENVIEVEEE